eukprot:11487483-Alexandrium_andersonii.AAC.2
MPPATKIPTRKSRNSPAQYSAPSSSSSLSAPWGCASSSSVSRSQRWLLCVEKGLGGGGVAGVCGVCSTASSQECLG